MLGWLVQAVAMTGFIYGGYLGATYRSGHDFVHLAKAPVVSSIGGLLSLPLFVLWPYVGLAVRSGAGALLSIIYLHKYRPLRLRWRFNFREWFSLVKEGLPIFVAGYGATTLWTVAETSIILRFLGTEALGLWTMSFMVVEAIIKVPQAMTAVYTPRVIECLGRTQSIRECLRLCKKPVMLGTQGMLLMGACWIVALPYIVPILMPKYTGAISTMCLMMLLLPLCIMDLPYQILVAMGKIQQNIAVYSGLICFVLLALAAFRLNMGLIGIVGASLIGRAFTRVFLVLYLFIWLIVTLINQIE